jgi:hypothetical protein
MNRMKWFLGAAGLALLAAGAVRAVVTGGQPGIIILIISGGVLVLSPLIVDRLESVSAGATSVEVRFSQQVASAGAPKAAGLLAQTTLPALVESYALVHQELPYDTFPEARVYLQDLLVDRAAAVAQVQKLDSREVRLLFAEGSAVQRVLALGLMTGDPSLADGASIAATVASPRSGNEQYHGLRLAVACWSRLERADRLAIRGAIEDAIASGGMAGSDRRELADQVMALPVG